MFWRGSGYLCEEGADSGIRGSEESEIASFLVRNEYYVGLVIAVGPSEVEPECRVSPRPGPDS